MEIAWCFLSFPFFDVADFSCRVIYTFVSDYGQALNFVSWQG
jgi:hypothetical protein